MGSTNSIPDCKIEVVSVPHRDSDEDHTYYQTTRIFRTLDDYCELLRHHVIPAQYVIAFHPDDMGSANINQIPVSHLWQPKPGTYRLQLRCVSNAYIDFTPETLDVDSSVIGMQNLDIAGVFTIEHCENTTIEGDELRSQLHC